MADLVVTISESVSINNKDHGSTNVETIGSVSQIDHRIVTATTTEQTIVLFDSAAAAGTFVDASVKYLRITNLDGTNFAILRILGNSEEYFVKIEAGDSFILGNSLMDANATGSQSVSLANIDSIKADADSASVSLEIFIAQ
tara:strand:- start:1048 stop:1473 length:426 start_codon:yes stop_codon:yes gene_type:complete